MSVKDIVKSAEKAYCDAFNAASVGGADTVPFYTSDCVYMPPGAPVVCGQANLKAAFDKYMKDCGAGGNAKMHISCQDAHEAGNFIIASGEYRITADGRDIDAGKYVTVYKQEGGKWKIFYDIFNANKA